MATDPIVFQMQVPNIPPPKRFGFFPGHKIGLPKAITVIAAVVITISMVSFAVFSVLTNNSQFSKKHGLDINQQNGPQQSNGTTVSDAALPGGGIARGVGGTTGTNSPVVTITANPASVVAGGKSRLSWRVTNNPSSCTASDDWSGGKPASGSADTFALTNVQTYLFTLTCKTATGTGFATVSVGATARGGTGSTATRPAVSLAANPTAIYKGDNSTLAWSVTNNPTSCTATGDWSGLKGTAGPESTGTLASVKTYSYTLTCVNSAGSGYATATVQVTEPPPDMPIVTLASNPIGPVTPGSSVTLTWTVTNNPSSCIASNDWAGNKNTAGGSQTVGPLQNIKTYTFTITCNNSTGGTFDAAAVQVLPKPPTVSLTVSPASMNVGNSATLTWSSTNSPTDCTASGDWSGGKSSSGTQSTGTIFAAKTYYFSLSCTNAGGTGYQNNVPLTVSLPPPPAVTLNANPITVTAGGSSTLTWSASNNPSSCTASGDWSGGKSSSGTQSTGALSTVKTYNYTLQCSNAGGSSSASTSVAVSSGGGGTSAPVVTIVASPSTIGTGSSSTLSWSATNNPTSCTASGAWSGSKSASGTTGTGIMNNAGTSTYTLSCSNSAGSGSKSATLTVIAIPVVSVSVSPSSITAGGSATISWSVANNPASCTAGGSWSGSKAASGSQSTGTVNSSGTYTYSLSCSNSGGTGTGSASLTVNNQSATYCGGKTPCYGPKDLTGHASVGNCWGWNLDWVINITSFRPSHKGGIRAGSTSTLENASATCDHDIHNILTGAASIPGYKDSNNNTTHNHNTATKSNTGSSNLSSYRTGYYDANKP